MGQLLGANLELHINKSMVTAQHSYPMTYSFSIPPLRDVVDVMFRPRRKGRRSVLLTTSVYHLLCISMMSIPLYFLWYMLWNAFQRSGADKGPGVNMPPTWWRGFWAWPRCCWSLDQTWPLGAFFVKILLIIYCQVNSARFANWMCTLYHHRHRAEYRGKWWRHSIILITNERFILLINEQSNEQTKEWMNDRSNKRKTMSIFHRGLLERVFIVIYLPSFNNVELQNRSFETGHTSHKLSEILFLIGSAHQSVSNFYFQG